MSDLRDQIANMIGAYSQDLEGLMYGSKLRHTANEIIDLVRADEREKCIKAMIDELSRRRRSGDSGYILLDDYIEVIKNQNEAEEV